MRERVRRIGARREMRDEQPLRPRLRRELAGLAAVQMHLHLLLSGRARLADEQVDVASELQERLARPESAE